MKSEFQAKFLQNLLKKRESEGFTLIELLVVIIIIGILSAIALPSFLNQANKARESEAKQYAGSMNRAQQAYFLEKTTFTTELGNLGLGIQSQTTNYQYFIAAGSGDNALASVTANSGTAAQLKTSVGAIASGINTGTLRSFVGLVDVATQQTGEGATTVAILCQKSTPGAPATGAVNFLTATTAPAALSCGTNFEVLE
jgi:type IV pilus assembly protein PilA